MPLLVANERNTGAGSARLIGPTFAVALDVPGDARDVRVAVVDRSDDQIYQGALPTPVEEG